MLTPELADRYTIETVLSESSVQLDLLLTETATEKRAFASSFRLGSFQEAIVEGIREAAQSLAACSFPNMLPIQEVVWDEAASRLFVIQSIDSLVPLSVLVEGSRQLPEESLWRVAASTVEALEAILAQHAVLGAHMSISVTNVFATEGDDQDFAVYLGLPCLDQALHPCVLADDVFKRSMCAPELFSDFIPNTKSDLYSLGTVLYTLAMLRKPFSLHTAENLLQSMVDREYLPLSGYSPDLITFIESLLDPNPETRPSLQHVTTTIPPQPKYEHRQPSASFCSTTHEEQPQERPQESPQAHAAGPRSKSPRQTDLSTEPDQNGNTTLMRHVKRNNWYIAQRFVETQAKIYNHEGMTALMLAARLGFVDIVKELIPYEAGMQSPSKDFEGYTALMFAAQRRNKQCVQLLLDTESGLVTKAGRTALMLAATNNDLDCVKLLLPREGGIQDNDGWSSLMDATIVRHLDIISLLGNRERSLKTSQGNTAADLVGLFVVDEEKVLVRDRIQVFESCK